MTTLILFATFPLLIHFGSMAECEKALAQLNAARPGIVNGVCVAGVAR
jgi:hypothetical protein